MSQDWTDDVYDSSHIAATDLANMEKNFAALKSCFSGSSAPANPTPGLWWYDTNGHLLKIRNESNNAWLSVWDLANNKPVLNLSNDITGPMISSSIKDAAAATASLRTLGAGAQQACAGNDYRLSNERNPPAASVSQAILKTSYGEVSGTGNFILPGGQYGFYPQVILGSKYGGGNSQIAYNATISSYTTNIYLGGGSALQRYIASSGEIHWYFILRDKETREELAYASFPDHPCYGNSGDPTKVEHPFGSYDPSRHEVVVITMSEAEVVEMKREAEQSGKGLLEILAAHYAVDEKSAPHWPSQAVTVGLPEGHDWTRMQDGAPVTPIKKTIPKPEYLIHKSLRKDEKRSQSEEIISRRGEIDSLVVLDMGQLPAFKRAAVSQLADNAGISQPTLLIMRADSPAIAIHKDSALDDHINISAVPPGVDVIRTAVSTRVIGHVQHPADVTWYFFFSNNLLRPARVLRNCMVEALKKHGIPAFFSENGVSICVASGGSERSVAHYVQGCSETKEISFISGVFRFEAKESLALADAVFKKDAVRASCTRLAQFNSFRELETSIKDFNPGLTPGVLMGTFIEKIAEKLNVPVMNRKLSDSASALLAKKAEELRKKLTMEREAKQKVELY